MHRDALTTAHSRRRCGNMSTLRSTTLPNNWSVTVAENGFSMPLERDRRVKTAAADAGSGGMVRKISHPETV